MIHSVFSDLAYGLRGLLARPVFALTAALALAFGIGANTAIFSVLKAVVLNPLPYPQAQQLVTLAQQDNDQDRHPTTVGYATFVDWKKNLSGLSSVAVFADWRPTLSGYGEARLLNGARVTQDYFSVLGVHPVLGRDFTEAESQSDLHNVVILSAALWQELFNSDPAVIGRTFTVNGRERSVVGVMPANFSPALYGNTVEAQEIWLPLGYDVAQPYACRSCQHLQTIGRLNANMSLAALRSQLDALGTSLLAQFPNEYPRTMKFVAAPLQDTLLRGADRPLWLLFLAVGLVLLIACLDVGNLLLVRGRMRQQELAVRVALGAAPTRLVRLLLIEALLIGLIGGALGIGLAYLTTSTLIGLGPASMPRLQATRVDGGVLVFALIVSLGVAIAAGLWPALRSARSPSSPMLVAGKRSSAGPGASRAQAVLIVAQIVAAYVLAVGAGLVLRSFDHVAHVNPGFEPAQLMGLNVAVVGKQYQPPGAIDTFYRQLLAQARAQPGVTSVAAITPVPFSGDFDNAGFHIKDRPIPGQEAPTVERYIATPGYFTTLQTPLLRGRDFSTNDTADTPPVAIVNESVARTLWPDEDALGKQIQLGGRDEKAAWATIVGVVGDIRQQGLDIAPKLQAYLPHAQQPVDTLTVLVRSSLPGEVIAEQTRGIVRAIDPALPVYAVASMAGRVSDSLAQRRFSLILFGLFASSALVLSAIGLYGVVSFTVSQQTRALGLRRALGASDVSVLRWVLSRSAWFLVTGLLIGIPASLLWGQLLSSQLVGISQHDPMTLIAVGAVLGLTVLLASIGPARRALRVQPTVALRYE